MNDAALTPPAALTPHLALLDRISGLRSDALSAAVVDAAAARLSRTVAAPALPSQAAAQ